MSERLFDDGAEFLGRLIGDRDISQSDIARALGVSPSRVSEWKNAKARPQPDNLVKLAQAFALDLDSLLRLWAYPTGAQAASDPDENEMLAIYRLVPSQHRETFKLMLRGLAAAQPTNKGARDTVVTGHEAPPSNRRHNERHALDLTLGASVDPDEVGRIATCHQSIKTHLGNAIAMIAAAIQTSNPLSAAFAR